MGEPAPNPRPPLDLQGARQGLQAFLIKVVARCQQSWHVLHHLGALPHTDLSSKLPYYQQAQAHPEVAARLSTKQAQALQLQSQLRRSGSCPASSGIPPRPHRARDAFGPGMVFVVNTVLAWLMFSIDVRNSMLG